MDIEYLAHNEDVIPTLTQWIYAEWSYLHPNRSYADVEELVSEGCNKNKIPISLVAMIDGKVVGWAALKTNDFKDRPDLSPWLGGLYVDEPHRNDRVGSKLVGAIETLAIDHGVEKLFLVTDDAEGFYSKLGWDVLERTESRDIAVVVMEKVLPG